jgi:ribosome-binding protein aMBF1 (putative translation factor)
MTFAVKSKHETRRSTPLFCDVSRTHSSPAIKVRAAPNLLGWSRDTLAGFVGEAASTIASFEAGVMRV